MVATDLGAKIQPVSARIDCLSLRSFNEAIGAKSDDAASHEFGSGHETTAIAPTYWFCLEMLADSEPMKWLTDSNIDLTKILHAKQDFTFHEQAKEGDWVTFHREIVDRYSKKEGLLEFIVKQTRVLNQADELIVEFLTTVAIRHTKNGQAS